MSWDLSDLNLRLKSRLHKKMTGAGKELCPLEPKFNALALGYLS